MSCSNSMSVKDFSRWNLYTTVLMFNDTIKCVCLSVTSRSVLFTWRRLNGCWICYSLWCQTIVRFRTKNTENTILKMSHHTRWVKMQSLWLRNCSIYQATSAGKDICCWASCSLAHYLFLPVVLVSSFWRRGHCGIHMEQKRRWMSSKSCRYFLIWCVSNLSALQPFLIKSSRGSQSTAPRLGWGQLIIVNPVVVPRQSAVNGWRPVWSSCQDLNEALKVREEHRPILMILVS